VSVFNTLFLIRQLVGYGQKSFVAFLPGHRIFISSIKSFNSVHSIWLSMLQNLFSSSCGEISWSVCPCQVFKS